MDNTCTLSKLQFYENKKEIYYFEIKTYMYLFCTIVVLLWFGLDVGWIFWKSKDNYFFKNKNDFTKKKITFKKIPLVHCSTLFEISIQMRKETLRIISYIFYFLLKGAQVCLLNFTLRKNITVKSWLKEPMRVDFLGSDNYIKKTSNNFR